MGSILGRQTNFHRLTKENFAVMHLRLAATNGMQNLHLVFVCSNSSIFNLIVQFTFTVMVVPYYLGLITEIQFYILEKCQLKPIRLWIIAKMCIDIYMKCMDIRQSALISVKAVLEIELVCVFLCFLSRARWAPVSRTQYALAAPFIFLLVYSRQLMHT